VNEQPLVSTVVTTYDRPQLVRYAIKSVLAQTYDPLEIIVVEDGSYTCVKEWLQEQGLRHVRYVRHEENKGLAAARNTGLRMAHGEFIAFLDDDDTWKPEKLQKQIALAVTLDSDYAIIYCGLEVRNKSGQIVNKKMPRLKGYIRNEIVQKGLSTIPSSCLFRKESLAKMAGFDTDIFTGIDHDIWMKMAKYGYKSDYVNEPLVICRKHEKLRITTDVFRRVAGIEQYLNKWRPEILEWFGQKAGKKYCSDYYVKVIGRLGVSLVLNGDTWRGRKVLWKVFSKEPKSFLLNRHLILVFFGGKYLYSLLKTSFSIMRNKDV
jgi:glycosyltransferase involved in cell wall biosynthesis